MVVFYDPIGISFWSTTRGFRYGKEFCKELWSTAYKETPVSIAYSVGRSHVDHQLITMSNEHMQL